MTELSTAAELTRDLERGISLPAAWFTDPGFLNREFERIFRRTWQYVGRAEQLTRVGDFITGTAGDIPVVVVRNELGLRGFVNVCRHRRHEVMSGAGNRKVLQCPYHAWSYGLDGSLKVAPRCEREDGFIKDNFPLLPVRVDTWGPFVFVNADLEAKALAHYLGELPQLIARSGVDLMQLQFRQRDEWRASANWKVLLENYLECYHCPLAHPGFSSVINVDPDAYLLRSFEWSSSQCAPVRASALDGTGKQPAYDARGAVVQAQHHFLWPNLTININPGHPNLSIDLWLPDGVDHTRGFSEQYFGPNVPPDFQEQLIAFNKQVSEEDDALTSSVQRGMRAGLPDRGQFLTKTENLAIHFEKLLLAAMS